MKFKEKRIGVDDFRSMPDIVDSRTCSASATALSTASARTGRSKP